MAAERADDDAGRVRALRAARGLTQAQLAALLSVSRASVIRWERGLARPAPAARQQLQRLAAGAAQPETGAAAGMAPSRARPPQPPSNLPASTTSFVGRERERDDIRRLLGTTRLLTLTGAGGCGKTRLAIEAVRTLGDDYPDGTWLVELAPLSEPALVPQTVAAVLGVREEPSRPLPETLARALRRRRLLLLLDNCEHLLAACAALVAELLRACPDVRVLTTSRELLAVAGETVVEVEPLTLPAAAAVTPDTLRESEAGRLFVERAQARRPRWAPAAANAAAVAQVCRRLDGLPLALELAAARVGLLAVEEIAARLDDRFRLLVGGDRTAPVRHQTLQAAIGWSYDLLEPAEQAVFRQLAVFAGDFDLASAEAVFATDSVTETDMLNLLGRLVDKSLVRVVEQAGAATRYRLLETLRVFGRESLAAAGETAATLTRHAAYHLALAEAEDTYIERAKRAPDYARLQGCLGDLRSALAWLLEADTGAAVRLAAALTEFWVVRGDLSEGVHWLRAGMGRDRWLPPTVRARALLAAGRLAREQGDLTAALPLLAEAAELAEELREDRIGMRARNWLASLYWESGDLTAARSGFEELLTIARRLDDQRSAATALVNLGQVALAQEDYSYAWTQAEEGRRLCQALGVPQLLNGADATLAAIAHAEGDLVQARTRYEAVLPRFEAMEHRRFIGLVLDRLAHIARQEGRYAESHALMTRSLRIRQEIGAQTRVAEGLTTAGILAATLQDHARAACLLGAADALYTRLGSALLPLYRADQARALAAGREGLGEQLWQLHWTAGTELSTDEAIALAIAPPSALGPAPAPPSGRPPGQSVQPGRLTERERDVLRLVAAGHSNKEIAATLIVSVRTVERHIENLYAKTAAHGRAAITAFAHRHGLA